MFKVLMYLILCGTAVHALTGCTVNVVVAPNATLAVESDLGQSAYQFVEGPEFSDMPGYDCVAGPDADVCQ